MVPRVRRAVEGVGAPAVLTDDEVKDLVADAIAAIILYTEGEFIVGLVVTADEDGSPTEYATTDVLPLPEQTLIALQAAIDHFSYQVSGVKVSEKIADEAQTWEWSKSAQLLRDKLKQLIDARDKVIDGLLEAGAPLDTYASFLTTRDCFVAAQIEPWVTGHLTSGQEDYRFNTLG